MLRLRPRFLLTLSILAAAAVCVVAAEQPPVPQESGGNRTGGKTAGATKESAGATSGVVVFIDPATGKIRQPDASEIGGLVQSTGSVAPKAPEPALIQGPGGAVGARLSEDALTYMVVTTAPDGKLAMDCVNGDKAAATRVAASPAPKAKETSQGLVSAQGPSGTKQAAPPAPQDTHDVKLPR
jgi:hypothetical protein